MEKIEEFNKLVERLIDLVLDEEELKPFSDDVIRMAERVSIIQDELEG